jgi:hypothetical protein
MDVVWVCVGVVCVVVVDVVCRLLLCVLVVCAGLLVVCVEVVVLLFCAGVVAASGAKIKQMASSKVMCAKQGLFIVWSLLLRISARAGQPECIKLIRPEAYIREESDSHAMRAAYSPKSFLRHITVSLRMLVSNGYF